MLNSPKNIYRLIRSFLQLLFAICNYKIYGRTPTWGQQALLSLFCYTNGKSNDLLSKFLSIQFPPQYLSSENTILLNFSESNIPHILDNINEYGYHIFEEKLPIEICNELEKFATETPCIPREFKHIEEIFNPSVTPISTVYDFQVNTLLKNFLIRKIMLDPAFVSIAQSYLGSQPILDIVSLWWTTNFSASPSSESAQLFHFDMERIKWLKFFIYLTDVTPMSGPHCFIKKTHRSGMIHPKIISRGYERISDDDVFSHYAADDYIEFCGPRGMIIAEDTRGLHKGKHIISGNRLILQLQFTNSLFGANYSSQLHFPPEKLSQEIKSRLPERVYSGFK